MSAGAALLARIRRAFATPPNSRASIDLGLAMVGFGATASLLGSATDLVEFAPRPSDEVAVLALRALFVPALGEELLFRAGMVPGPQEGVKPLVPITVSTFAFALWHIAETTFLPNSASTFLRADFLALAALLGLACALLRWRSGSIWTAVALHWMVVVAWQGWFGGPSFGASM